MKLNNTKDGKRPIQEFPLSDLGNAERLVYYHSHELRYCMQHGKWYVWDGKRWAPDETGAIMRLAKDTVRRIYGEGEVLKPSDGASPEERNAIETRRKTIIRHALRSESDDSLLAMVKLAQTEESVVIKADALDRDAYLFNVFNGTIDLRTGKLRPHNRDDMITKISPVRHDPISKAPKWITFLNQIMAGDTSLVTFLQKAAGYSLSADVTEQILLFLYGLGANGKSTFTGVLEYFFGDYAQKAPRSLIQMKRNGDDGVPCDVARLQGARFVVCNELEEGRRIAESLVKDLTGGDRLVARFMRQNLFEFPPTHKLWMYGNHRPTITGTDGGIWRRIHLIPFTVVIPPKKRNAHLKQVLIRNEASGILNWLIRGCLLWQREGLLPPRRVVAAVKEYRKDMDTVGEFIDDICILNNNAWTSSSQLHKKYTQWATKMGIDMRFQLGLKSFANRLRDRGLVPEKDPKTGARGWAGIRLKGEKS